MFLATEIIIILIVGWRVITKRMPVSETLAWLLAIILVPLIGAALFLIVAETPIGRKRAKRAHILKDQFKIWHHDIPTVDYQDLDRLEAGICGMSKLISHSDDYPLFVSNHPDLLSTEEATLDSVARDIDLAKKSVHICMYIWEPGGKVDKIQNALIKAQQRGVDCRVLVDHIGSRSFLNSNSCHRLKSAGVNIVPALKAGVLRAFFRRLDLRNHRKIISIDQCIAYTGSMNMVDSRHYAPWSKLGGWIDAVIRVENDSARALEFVFAWDWFLETGEYVHPPVKSNPQLLNNRLPSIDFEKKSAIQILPTGRNLTRNHIHNIFLNLIFRANKQITITTPYLVPTDGLLSALCSAAKRGVDVRVIVPKVSDTYVVSLASKTSYPTLLKAGVKIFLYEKGLLHAKTLSFDEKVSMVGSLNLDTRSFYINFEICPIIYSPAFTKKLIELQRQYERDSLCLEQNFERQRYEKFLGPIARLLSPIL